MVLPFWYQLTRLVPELGPLNVCVCALRITFAAAFLTHYPIIFHLTDDDCDCGTAGPLGSVPGMWNHLQGDQVN